MSSSRAIELLQAGPSSWNSWRKKQPEVSPDLRNVDLARQNLSAYDFGPETPMRKPWYLIREPVSRVDFSGANLAYATLSRLGYAKLCGTCLDHAHLHSAHLNNTDLREASLRNTTLDRARMTDANLAGACLEGASLVKADLFCANLTDTNLRNSDFRVSELGWADLRGADLSGARTTEEHESTRYVSFLALGHSKNLTEAIFDEDDFANNYTQRAFKYAHREYTEEARGGFGHLYLAKSLHRIQTLQEVTPLGAPSNVAIEISRDLTAEILKRLRQHPHLLYELRPRQFEELIAEILTSYGWSVDLTAASRDGGYDIFGIVGDTSGVRTSWIIECKKYSRERKVGVEIARALYAVKTGLSVANAMLVTTSHFTKGVNAMKASKWDLDLRDFEAVVEWVNEYRPHPEGKLYIREQRLVLPSSR